MITFVVGLYKSGTSLISSLLDEMGKSTIVDRNAYTTGLTRKYNIHESYVVNSLNNEILDRYSSGCIYYQNSDLPTDICESYYQRIRNFYSEHGTDFFIKDPRFIGTLKYWIKCLPKGTDYNIIYVNREKGLLESFRVDSWFNDKIVDGDYKRSIRSLKSNYEDTKLKFEGLEIDFDLFRNDLTKLGHVLYNFLTTNDSKLVKIRFGSYYQSSGKMDELFSKQTPGNSGTWKNIVSIGDNKKCDFEVVQDKTSCNVDLNKTIFFGREPKHVCLHNMKHSKINFHHEDGNSWLPQTWWVNKPFDFLSELSYPEKPNTLSIIDSGKTNLQGHKVRTKFINKLLNLNDDRIHLFGKMTQKVNYKNSFGLLPERDKYDGLISYKYNLSIENGRTDFYFSEKFVDPLLCYSLPIYYGCNNIHKFFPEKSYVLLDIEDKHSPDKLLEILNTPISDEQISAIQESRDLILNKYNIWNTIYLAVNFGKIL